MNARLPLALALLAACKGRAESEACGATMARTEEFDSNLMQLTAAAGQQLDSVGFQNSSKSMRKSAPYETGSSCQGTCSGNTWTQSGSWSGARGSQSMCGSGDSGTYTFTVDITTGTHHQIGVAQAACCSGVSTSSSSSSDNWAALYSHHSGWDRHRGAAQPVGSPSTGTWWSGTWDHPNTVDLTVNCATSSFIVGIQGGDSFLGEMSWPTSWSEVYFFTGGQSSDHVVAVTASSTPSVQAAAVGDPHLQNMFGERFDLAKPGKSILVSIPRGTPVEDALLVVQADARQMGARCSDMYFQEINITGKWAKADLQFNAQGMHDEKPTWAKFGPVELKVAHGCTEKGVEYLNLYVRHLGRAGAAVGGLLGEDDHTEAAALSAACRKTMSLAMHATRSTSELQDASVAFAAAL